jgi:four helix bundle protein
MILSFKDLRVWKAADELAHRIYTISDGFPKQYLYDLTAQLRRAALSIPANIAEGCASQHTKELLQFLNISRRSLYETHYLILFAFNRELISGEVLKDFESQIDGISRMLSGLMKSLRQKKSKRAIYRIIIIFHASPSTHHTSLPTHHASPFFLV